ncbi:MAG: hypothetical protein J6X81_00355 [Muribaculaceae bacterium]|nr:hypothetical protein [Muribaculaceae bacterium]
MNGNSRNEYRFLALLATLIVAAAVLFVLLTNHLHYQFPPEDQKDLALLEQDSIMFGGEYVMLGTSPESTGEATDVEEPEQVEDVKPEPDIAGEDLRDAGEPAKQPKPVVTAKEESPMKVKEKPKEKEKPVKTGPATDENTVEKQEKVKRGVDAATENKVKNAFGKSSGTGNGKQGSPNGNNNTGALNGKPGIGGLDGYTLEYWGRPHSQWTGTVVVRVRVDTRGKIVEATCVGGTGGAYSHPSVRRYCEQETLKSRFSVPKSTTTEGIGTVTWRFVD